VEINFTPIKVRRICGCSYFIATSLIAYNLRLISNLQYRLSEYPIALPCCEEELASLFSDSKQGLMQDFWKGVSTKVHSAGLETTA